MFNHILEVKVKSTVRNWFAWFEVRRISDILTKCVDTSKCGDYLCQELGHDLFTQWFIIKEIMSVNCECITLFSRKIYLEMSATWRQDMETHYDEISATFFRPQRVKCFASIKESSLRHTTSLFTHYLQLMTLNMCFANRHHFKGRIYILSADFCAFSRHKRCLVPHEGHILVQKWENMRQSISMHTKVTLTKPKERSVCDGCTNNGQTQMPGC